MFQRQLSKEGLQSLVNNAAGGGGGGGPAAEGGAAAEGGGAPDVTVMSAEDLRDIFTLRLHTKSDTYDSLCTAKDEAEGEAEEEREGSESEGEEKQVISLGDSDSDVEAVEMDVGVDAKQDAGNEEGGNAADPTAAVDEVDHKPQVTLNPKCVYSSSHRLTLRKRR